MLTEDQFNEYCQHRYNTVPETPIEKCTSRPM